MYSLFLESVRLEIYIGVDLNTPSLILSYYHGAMGAMAFMGVTNLRIGAHDCKLWDVGCEFQAKIHVSYLPYWGLA